MAADMRSPVFQAIVAARVNLLFDEPWYGNLITRLEIIDASSEIDAIEISFNQLRYSDDAVKRLTPEKLQQELRRQIDVLVAGLAAPSLDGPSGELREFVAAMLNARADIGRSKVPRSANAYLDAL